MHPSLARVEDIMTEIKLLEAKIVKLQNDLCLLQSQLAVCNELESANYRLQAAVNYLRSDNESKRLTIDALEKDNLLKDSEILLLKGNILIAQVIR